MAKRQMNQPLPQSGKLERHAATPHYSETCQCRTCRRLRAKQQRKPGTPGVTP
jgi:hypothetical protein